MSLLILRRECRAVYPLDVVVNLVGAAPDGSSSQHAYESGTPDMAHIMVRVNHVIEAVKSTVPQEMWGEIVRKLDQLEKHSGSPGVETDTSCDEADDGYDPIEFAEEDDDF